MKRMLSAIVILTLLFSLSLGVSAESERDLTVHDGFAQKLSSLGLFLGTENGFELDRKLTRTESLVMMLRALGKADEAADYGKTHPFSDVASWADGYVSYAYDAGLTKGISDTLFGADDEIQSNMYLTFILRALGFTDGENKDFIWQMPYALAGEVQILPPETDLKEFLRADAATVAAAALFSRLKDSDDLLYTRLISEGVFSKEAFSDTFPEDPFSEYKMLNQSLNSELADSKTEPNKYKFNQFLILDTQYAEDTIKATVLTHEVRFSVDKNNTISSNGTSGSVRSFEFDKNTCEIISSGYPGYDFTYIFPESAIGPTGNLVWQGMNIALGNKISKIIETGALSYRQPSYDEAIALLTPNSAYSVEKILETEQCTVALGSISGIPHGPYAWLSLIYKPNSAYGEGNIVNLPLPAVDAWSRTVNPDTLYLSDDSLTLYYSYYFEEEFILDLSTESERLIHEAGTYNYTVDLTTGEVKLEIVK